MEAEKKPYEEVGRLEKVLALVVVILAFAQKHKLDALELVNGLGHREWWMFAKMAGKPFPSEMAKKMVRASIGEAHRLLTIGAPL